MPNVEVMEHGPCRIADIGNISELFNKY